MLTDWTLVLRKPVRDFDGAWTDYSWYVQGDHHVFVFGDSDLYRPEDEEWDWECDSWVEAQEWFADYRGEEYSEEDEFHHQIQAEVDEMLAWMNIRTIQK